ncbi:MAG: hypothetical protein AB7O62_09905 [Pirellulales bacterium]
MEYYGESPRAEFVLRVPNPFDHDVCFEQIAAGCSCSRAILSKKCLAADESTEISAVVQLPASSVQRDLAFTLITDAGIKYVQQVRLIACPSVSLPGETEMIDLGPLPPNTKRKFEQALLLTAAGLEGPVPVVERLEVSNSAGLKAALVAPSNFDQLPSQNARRAIVSIELQADTAHLAPGQRSTDLVIDYSLNGEVYSRTIPVYWRVLSPFRVVPARVFFRRTPGDNSPAAMSVSISRHDLALFSIREITCHDSRIMVDSAPTSDERREHGLTVRFNPGLESDQPASPPWRTSSLRWRIVKPRSICPSPLAWRCPRLGIERDVVAAHKKWCDFPVGHLYRGVLIMTRTMGGWWIAGLLATTAWCIGIPHVFAVPNPGACVDVTGAPCFAPQTGNMECDDKVHCLTEAVCAEYSSLCGAFFYTRRKTTGTAAVGTCQMRVYKNCFPCGGNCGIVCQTYWPYLQVVNGNCDTMCLSQNFHMVQGCSQ